MLCLGRVFKYHMIHSIKTVDDLRWFLTHTEGFRGGLVTDVRVSRRWIFDDESGRDVSAGSTVTVLVRYHAQDILRVARLTMLGVTDFSILEQGGGDCSVLNVVQVELCEGKLRFWFDPNGDLYVVCDEATFEEVSFPSSEADLAGGVTQWTFQADSGKAPTVAWLLQQLDQAGMPCIWKAATSGDSRRMLCWEGKLVAATDRKVRAVAALEVQAYGLTDGIGFGMRVQFQNAADRLSGRLMGLVADLVTQCYDGTCLEGRTCTSREAWSGWESPRRVHPARS